MALGDVLFVADGTLHTKDLCLCKSLLLLHGTEVHGEESNKLSLVFTFFFFGQGQPLLLKTVFGLRA